MKIDLDYIKLLLNTAIESEMPFITIRDWEKQGIKFDGFNKPLDHKFIFHLKILINKKLITNFNKSKSPVTLEDLGIMVLLKDSSCIMTNPVPVCLTQEGHDFAGILRNGEVLNRLKSDFQNMTYDVILDAGKTLLSAFAKKKLESLKLA